MNRLISDYALNPWHGSMRAEERSAMFQGDEFDKLGFAASPEGDAVADSAKSYAEWFCA